MDGYDYAVAGERIGRALADAFMKSKEPGVEVRVTFDDTSEMKKGGEFLVVMLTATRRLDAMKTAFSNPPSDPTIDMVIELLNGSCIIIGPSPALLEAMRQAGRAA